MMYNPTIAYKCDGLKKKVITAKPWTPNLFTYAQHAKTLPQSHMAFWLWVASHLNPSLSGVSLNLLIIS